MDNKESGDHQENYDRNCLQVFPQIDGTLG